MDRQSRCNESVTPDSGAPSNLSDEELPDFREYARRKYGEELDEDLITMIEDLIERQRRRIKSGREGSSTLT